MKEEYIKKLKELYNQKIVSFAIVPKGTQYSYQLALDIKTLKDTINNLER